MNVTTHILQCLENVAPSAVSAHVLLAEVRITRGGCGEGEFAAAVRACEDAGMIVRGEDPLTRDLYWSITPAGTQRLREGG
jgi:hypothetical protein